MSAFVNYELPVCVLPVLLLLIGYGLMSIAKRSLTAAVFSGNTERVAYLAEALMEKASYMNRFWGKTQEWFATRPAALSSWAQARKENVRSAGKAVAKGFLALAMGLFALLLLLVAGVGAAANLTVATYRKARASLKARILNWLGATEMVNELKRENAKLNLKVRRLEILQQVADHDYVVQTEADKMAEVLDAEFRTQLEVMHRDDIQWMWLQLYPGYSWRSTFCKEWGIEDIMVLPPGHRAKAYEAFCKVGPLPF